MEWVKRVENPTTLILEDDAAYRSARSLSVHVSRSWRKGRAGDHALRIQAPTSRCVRELINALVPHQDGDVTDIDTSTLQDAEANARALKSLSYALGADLTGIREIPGLCVVLPPIRRHTDP